MSASHLLVSICDRLPYSFTNSSQFCFAAREKVSLVAASLLQAVKLISWRQSVMALIYASCAFLIQPLEKHKKAE